MKKNIWLSTLAIIGILALSLYIYTIKIGALRAHIITFEYIFFALFAFYLAAVIIILNVKFPIIPTLITITVFAILFRLVFLFSAPSLSYDIYRYLWDGKVQAAGMNPYLSYPNSQETKPLRDKSVFPHISSRSSYDPYQPVSQLFFRLIYYLKPDSIFAFKLALVLLDLGSAALVILILKELRVDLNRVLIYAWNPLILFEIAHSGHIDALIAFFLLAAIFARLKTQHILTGVLLGLAIPIKLFPIILFPAFFNKGALKRREFKMPAALVGTIALVYLPFIKAGLRITRFIFEFQGGPWFNSGIRYFLLNAFRGNTVGADKFYVLLVFCIFVIASVAIFFKEERTSLDFIRHIFLISILFVIFAPFLAPWSLVFLIPLLPIILSPSIFYLSGAVMLSYLFYAQEPWKIPEWVRYVEYTPFFILLTLEISLPQYLKNNICHPPKDLFDKQAKPTPS